MNDEQPITLAEAAELFPKRKGKAISVAALKYRIIHGCRGVRLFGYVSGGMWFTTREAVERFEAAVNAKVFGEDRRPRGTKKASRDFLKGLGISCGKKETRKATTR